MGLKLPNETYESFLDLKIDVSKIQNIIDKKKKEMSQQKAWD